MYYGVAPKRRYKRILVQKGIARFRGFCNIALYDALLVCGKKSLTIFCAFFSQVMLALGPKYFAPKISYEVGRNLLYINFVLVVLCEI